MSYQNMQSGDGLGNYESFSLPDGWHERHSGAETVDLTDPELGRITRLRLLGDRDFPFLDLSYCHGELKDGTPVRVQLPRHQFPKRGLCRALVEMCQQAKVYGKGIGITDPNVWSVLS